MSIVLFEHNQQAYEAALAGLSETGKAAIVHPTGTGKSFIGFKLCEDHPEQTVVWLSPSEYIFKTQLENLEKTGAEKPANIRFFTYAKLMYLTAEELQEIKPDYFVLDEFHRCGSEVWGKYVKKLLFAYPEVPVLGLSATSVRYLDNQRNMAEELFDGNIVSEMTLGEAIVRGILKAPLYVSTVFSYQKELEKYEKKLQMSRYTAVRSKVRDYLEQLRRTLERADGLETIFERYMPDRHGKYLVFCSNREHLDEMAACVPEWFGKMDPEARIYKVYSDYADADEEFDRFKKDDSRHLRFLFCIDMLNEGIHVDGIDGVILFRPTVSPTVYKQQIGRALTAGKGGTPVIFDIINNFENLYSMGSIEQEMAVAVTYYNSLGESNKIIADRFRVVGIVQKCVELFEKLNEALTATWQEMFECAKSYYEIHGNLDVPKNYKTGNQLSLRNWLDTQRRIRNGTVQGILTEERIALLNTIGMRWESCSDLNWEKNYAAAVKYYEEHGALNPAASYVTEEGIRLGAWLTALRTYRKSGIHNAYMTAERISLLDAAGMVWDVSDSIFERYFAAAKKYYRKNGTLDVPAKYVTEEGIRLGAWIAGLRSQQNRVLDGNRAAMQERVDALETVQGESHKNGGLNKEQIQRLDEIGMIWTNKYSLAWEKGFLHAKEYYAENKNLEVSTAYLCEDGFALGKWIARNRKEWEDGKLTENRKEKLSSVGMQWKKTDTWENRFLLAKKYYEENGALDISQEYQTEGIWLGRWIYEQRQIYLGNRKGKTLSDTQRSKLESIGMNWTPTQSRQWEQGFHRLLKYKLEFGNVAPAMEYKTEDSFCLGRWVYHQRKKYSEGTLAGERIERLRKLGVKL